MWQRQSVIGLEIKAKAFYQRREKSQRSELNHLHKHSSSCAYAAFINEASGNNNNSHPIDLLWPPPSHASSACPFTALDVISRFDYLKLLS